MFQDGFPNNLKDDVSKVEKLIPLQTYGNLSIGVTEETIQYFLDGVVIKFPYRMYYISISDEAFRELNLQQKMILHCIYSRRCDGQNYEVLP